MILIIGAGMSGLSSAATLVKEGREVLILEKSSDVGGLVHTFEYKGYKFDTGPRAIENSGMVKPMLKKLGIELNWIKSDVSWGIKDRIVPIKNLGDVEQVKKLILDLYPDDQRGIERIFRRIDKAIKIVEVINRVDNPFIRSPLSSLKHLLFTVLPWMPSFLLTLLRLPLWSKPMEFSMNRRVKNQNLRDILTQHYFKHTPESFALGYFHTFTDYYYPKGGTGQLPKKLAEYISNHGGEIEFNSTVTAVEPEAKIVTLTDGRTIEYERLIWTGDENSWKDCIKTSPPKSIIKDRTGESVFSIFTGVKVEPDVFRDISNGHFIYTPDTKGLGELHRSIQDDMVDNFEAKTKDEILDWITELCRYNTYEIAIPTLRDNSMAPEGCTGLIISLLIDGRLFSQVAATEWYEEFVDHFKNSMLQTLNESIYPFLLEHMEFSKVATPLTLMEMFGIKDGSITGWSLEKYKASSLMGVLKSVKTEYKDHYRAGQWTYSPAGVPIAILTGVLASKEVLK